MEARVIQKRGMKTGREGEMGKCVSGVLVCVTLTGKKDE